jgi:FKBP-type peptidyl-prolyl cis-trans isomerase 2
MQNEKIAIIALIIIVAGALSVFLVVSSGEDFFDSLFPSSNNGQEPINENMVEIGDCIDIQYIGRFENNTVFDSSYANVDDKTDGTPLKIFVTLNKTELAPIDYRSNYSSGIIDGLMEELPGLELGETYTIGPIDPAKAYGAKKLEVGSTFNTATFAINTLDQTLSLNQTLEVTKITDTLMDLVWINIDQLNVFTMPQIILGNLSSSVQEEMINIPPPYFIWENASQIEAINENSVTVKTTPNKLSNIFDNIEQIQYGFGTNDIYMIFPDATTATYDDTTITLVSDPTQNAEYQYVYEYYGQQIIMNYKVEEVTNDTINVSATYADTNESQYIEVNKTLSFDRSYDLKKTYNDIPMVYAESLIGMDIEREGYSLHELAGEALIFEVYVENIIKTSQIDN